ncbi:flavin reductase family protein [Providencia rettgeri]|uniref:flavin reductase family protein n=1 Tax=Providencia rettgeri TaxID=587 RepID=UPI00223AC627
MHDSLPAEKAYRILEAGPVILVSTRGTDDRTNLMTAGFHMMMQHAPPLVGVIIGPWDYSYQALSDTGECVLAVPPAGMAKAVVDIGNCSGETDDKFARFGLTPVAAQSVSAPLVDECLANQNWLMAIHYRTYRKCIAMNTGVPLPHTLYVVHLAD